MYLINDISLLRQIRAARCFKYFKGSNKSTEQNFYCYVHFFIHHSPLVKIVTLTRSINMIVELLVFPSYVYPRIRQTVYVIYIVFDYIFFNSTRIHKIIAVDESFYAREEIKVRSLNSSKLFYAMIFRRNG